MPSEALSWRDLSVIVSERSDESALSRCLDKDWRWDLKAQLAAIQVDLLAGANWQRSGDTDISPPKPLQRPGIEPEKPDSRMTARPMDEFDLRRQARKARNRKVAGRH